MKPWLLFGYVQGELRMLNIEALTSAEAFAKLQEQDKLNHGCTYHIVEVTEVIKED